MVFLMVFKGSFLVCAVPAYTNEQFLCWKVGEGISIFFVLNLSKKNIDYSYINNKREQLSPVIIRNVLDN